MYKVTIADPRTLCELMIERHESQLTVRLTETQWDAETLSCCSAMENSPLMLALALIYTAMGTDMGPLPPPIRGATRTRNGDVGSSALQISVVAQNVLQVAIQKRADRPEGPTDKVVFISGPEGESPETARTLDRLVRATIESGG